MLLLLPLLLLQSSSSPATCRWCLAGAEGLLFSRCNSLLSLRTAVASLCVLDANEVPASLSCIVAEDVPFLDDMVLLPQSCGAAAAAFAAAAAVLSCDDSDTLLCETMSEWLLISRCEDGAAAACIAAAAAAPAPATVTSCS